MPANPAEWVSSHHQTPIARVVVDKKAAVLRITSVSVDLGYDAQTSTARVAAASPVLPTWKPGQSVAISLGFGGPGGGLQPVFEGEIEDVDLSFFPHRVEFAAAGYLRRTLPGYYEGLAYHEKTDGFLWTEMMRKSAVPRYASEAAANEGILYGGQHAVELRKGDKPRDLVDKLDQSSPGGMRTWEIAGSVLRTLVSPIPSASVAFHYGQGAVSHPVIRVLSLRRTDTLRELANRVLVTGHPEADGTEVFAERRADSPYVPNDPDGLMRDFAHDFSSDIIENRTHCDLVAQRLMQEKNRRKDDLTLRGPLNPFLMPGASLGITASQVGLTGERPYWIRHVRHSYGPGGAWSEADLEGGAGDTGYLIGLDPIAAFTYTASSEAFLVGGVSQRMYTLVCDGSPSFDPDGMIASYAWSASNGAAGTGVIFTVAFTAEQWEAEEPPTVTLTVTDADSDPTGPHTGTHSETISVEAEPLILRTLYVAADGQADCTPDGGETWNTWTPPAGRVISTPEIAAIDHSYFGLDTGALYQVGDALFGPPTLVHTFPAAVRCVWMNEANAYRVWVGLSNGQVWFTAEGDLLDAAEWAQKADFPSAVEWLVESYATDGQVRVCTGGQVLITHDSFATQAVLTTMPGGDAKNIALSFFGNYASGSSPTAPVVHEDSSPVPFPGTPPQEVRITAFADRDSLLAVDENGQAWVKGEGQAGFAAAGAVGQGGCGHVVRDGEQVAVFYAASAEGVAKSYDRGGTWLPLRDYAGASLTGLQIGYGAAPMSPPSRIRFFERVSTSDPEHAPVGNGAVIGCSLDNPNLAKGNDTAPAGWFEVGYDPAPWTGFAGYTHTWEPVTSAIIFGADEVFFRALDVWTPDSNPKATWEHALFRHTFTVPDPGADGPWRRLLVEAHGITGAAGGGNQRSAPIEMYLNGTRLELYHGYYYADPALLVADGATPNVLAVRAAANNSFLAGHRVVWKLTGSTDPVVVSLSTEGDGALYWRPTGECAMVLYQPLDAPPAGWNAPAAPDEIPTAGVWRSFNYSNLVNDPIVDPLLGGVGQPGSVNAVNPADAVIVTFRHPALLPPSSSGGPYRRATLRWARANETGFQPAHLMGVWLNGQALDVAATGEYEIDPALLVPGGWNAFCAELSAPSDAIWGPWCSYLLRIEP